MAPVQEANREIKDDEQSSRKQAELPGVMP
jgi:hypothetical protein